MQHQNGSTILLVMTIALSVATVALAGFGFWAFTNYQEQKNNVDGITAERVSVAQAEQKAVDEASFLEREKLPVRQFVGPSDLGQVTFDFPKTWSVYIGEDASNGGTYEAFFHPGAVVNQAELQPYALRLSIVDGTYENILASFQGNIDAGLVKSSSVTVDGQTGIRLDGQINENFKGSMIVLKSRDKTIELYTEAEAFLGDFNNIVLPSLKFNP